MSPSLDYIALLPEFFLVGSLMLVLTADIILPKTQKYWTAVLAILGLTLTAFPIVFLALQDDIPRTMLDGSYVVDDFSLVLKGLFVAAGYIVVLMSFNYIDSDRYYQGEYYFLLMASILGSVVMASARDLILLFVGLELVSGPLFLLAGWRKGDEKSNEASLKFYLLGVLSAAILLYGMSFLYGLTGAVDFDGIRAASVGMSDEPAFIMAILFIMVGFAFKVSAVPFHLWAPDTYQGAPTPVTAYMSVSSKAAGFVGMLVVTYVAFPDAGNVWGPALWILAALSMTVGNLTALRQTNIVRLLAYSSVAQAGFMLVPFAVAGVSSDPDAIATAFSATVTYIAVYTFMNLGAFAVVIGASNRIKSGLIENYAGLNEHSPMLAIAGAMFFLSLAGIPPLAGWFAKLVMFNAAIGGGSVWTTVLAGIAALNAVIAFYYYARVVKAMFFDPIPDSLELSDPGETRPLQLAIVMTGVFVIAAGFYPAISTFFGDTVASIVAGG